MSGELEAAYRSISMAKVPDLWAQVSYPSLKPLPSYLEDLYARLAMLQVRPPATVTGNVDAFCHLLDAADTPVTTGGCLRMQSSQGSQAMQGMQCLWCVMLCLAGSFRQ